MIGAAFESNPTALNFANDDELDLSFSITPEHRAPPAFQPIPSSSARPPPTRSTLRPSLTPSRPNTYPQQSALRPPPQTIPEDSILDPAFPYASDFAERLHRDMENPDETFWSGTPLPLPQLPTPQIAPLPTVSTWGIGSASVKPGYLKTPSKRSVVRAKRPDLHASPQKNDRSRGLSPAKRLDRLGAMSAPPAQRRALFANTSTSRGIGDGQGQDGIGGEGELGEVRERGNDDGDAGVSGVKSFQRRLREGGFGRSLAPGAAISTTPISTSFATARGRGSGTGRGRTRFGFGNGETIQLRGGESLR